MIPVAQRRCARLLSVVDAAWLAGVLDCDGSIVVLRRPQSDGRAPSYLPSVRVGQVRSELVQRCGEVTAVGHVVLDSRGVWTWQAAAQQAADVLRQVEPYLVLKKTQATLAILMAERVREYAARGFRRLDDVEVAARQAIYEQARDLNAPAQRDVPDALCPRS